MISVLLVEDQNSILQFLKTYLEQESDLEIVGVAVNGEEALHKIEQLQPDVVVMDIEMPKIDGLSATKIISQYFTQTKVLILSTHDDDYYLNDALQLGAKGYLLKNTPPQELANTIRAVNQGYFQLGPGLLEKSLPKLAVAKISNQSSSISESTAHHPQKKDYLSSPSKESASRKPGKKFQHQSNYPPKQTSRLNYLDLGVLLNMVIWTLVLAYLKFSIPIYTSKLGVKIIETNPEVEVMTPHEGKTTSVSSDWLPSSKQDSKNDYIYIATSSQVLEKSAYLMGITVEAFGEPKITVDRDNSIIDFSIVGNTPEEAQQKAMSLYQVITKQIETLRTEGIQKQAQKTQITLESAREKLNIAQQKLAKYQSISGLDSNEKTKNIAAKIETVRQQQAELLAQQKGVSRRYVELSQSFSKLFSTNAEDAYKLETNDIYREYQEQYTQARKDLTSLLTRFTSDHPLVIEKKEQLAEITAALQKQASALLGKPMSLSTIAKMIPVTIDSELQITRRDLLKNIANNRAEVQQLIAENKELEAQIIQLEDSLKTSSTNQFEADSLRRDLQVAEAIFTATLNKLDLGQENIYSIYPSIQLITEPTRPEKPRTPSLSFALWSGISGSFLVTTGLVILCFDRSVIREKI